MSNSTQEILKREPITRDQLMALDRAFRPMEKMICGFNVKEIDIKFGRGVLESKSGHCHCLWNKKGIRFTIWIASDSGNGMSAGREPDPYYLKAER